MSGDFKVSVIVHLTDMEKLIAMLNSTSEGHIEQIHPLGDDRWLCLLTTGLRPDEKSIRAFARDLPVNGSIGRSAVQSTPDA